MKRLTPALADQPRGFLAPAVIDVGEDQPGALLREQQRSRSADPRPAPVISAALLSSRRGIRRAPRHRSPARSPRRRQPPGRRDTRMRQPPRADSPRRPSGTVRCKPVPCRFRIEIPEESPLGREFLVHARVGDSRGDGADSDAVLREFLCQRLNEPDKSELRRAVGAHVRVAVNTRLGGGAEQRAASGCLEMRAGILEGQEGAEDVDRERALELGKREVGERTDAEDPRVGERQVQPPISSTPSPITRATAASSVTSTSRAWTS